MNELCRDWYKMSCLAIGLLLSDGPYNHYEAAQQLFANQGVCPSMCVYLIIRYLLRVHEHRNHV